MSEAAPGDVIVESGWRQGAAGYAGIVVDHGRIVSMGTAATVQNNHSLLEFQRSPHEMAIFRYIGVQKCPSYPLANQVYNPDEARVPAGQPGGGQWTNTGAGTKAQQRLAARLKSPHTAKSGPAPTPDVRQRQIHPDVAMAPRLAAADDDDDPKTIGEAAKETGRAFLSRLASFAKGIRPILFPSEPDREPSKPKNIFQLDKEVNDAAEGIDMTKPKGLGDAVAAGAAIAGGEAISDGAIRYAGSLEPQGLLRGGETGNRYGPGAADTGDVPTIGGRLPINNKYAGGVHPAGVEFTPQGFPNFGPHSVAEVELDGLTGDIRIDSKLANDAMGYPKTPRGYVWHHVEDGRTMQLVPEDLHQAVRHTGGAAVIRNEGFDK